MDVHPVLNRSLHDAGQMDETTRTSIFVFRCFIYVCSMGHRMYIHAKSISLSVRKRHYITRFGCICMPGYLANWKECASLILTLLLFLMLCTEPILHCTTDPVGHAAFCQTGARGDQVFKAYSLFSTGAMFMHFCLLTDLSVLSTHVSAFVLVCGRVLSELALFLFGQSFVVFTFACGISAMDQDSPDFDGIPASALTLYKMTFGMFSGRRYDDLDDHPWLLIAVFLYIATTAIFLLNLLIAQLNTSYHTTYQDMLGFARLHRGKVVAETMPVVSKIRWQRFVALLRLNEPCEFGEGDLGPAGGLRIFEPASASIVTADAIRRFGGSTSPAAQWPEEESFASGEADRLDRMEKLFEKAMKRVTTTRSKHDSSGGGGSSEGNPHSGVSYATSVTESHVEGTD
mmetsp:Transcript_105815/g.306075  ORF Transcript_105815/g.306075 Transcript_105815/m.306075 type:complete len:401 (+) Transcript_105815:2-1204(+)